MGLRRHLFSGTGLLAVLALWVLGMGLLLAAAPPVPEGKAAVVFQPGTSGNDAFAALIRAGARPIGQGWAAWIWAVDLDRASAAELKRQGALFVVRTLPFAAALGCSGALRVAGSPASGAPHLVRP